MKYCNQSDCKWNDRKGACTYMHFEDEGPEEAEDRECMKHKTPEPPQPAPLRNTVRPSG